MWIIFCQKLEDFALGIKLNFRGAFRSINTKHKRHNSETFVWPCGVLVNQNRHKIRPLKTGSSTGSRLLQNQAGLSTKVVLTKVIKNL